VCVRCWNSLCAVECRRLPSTLTSCRKSDSDVEMLDKQSIGDVQELWPAGVALFMHVNVLKIFEHETKTYARLLAVFVLAVFGGGLTADTAVSRYSTSFRAYSK
jgi:hypothetical protein